MIKEMYSEAPEILEASRIYNDALADDATRYHALSREKFLRDQLSRKELAFEEGEAEGKTQGLAEGKAERNIEIARNLIPCTKHRPLSLSLSLSLFPIHNF